MTFDIELRFHILLPLFVKLLFIWSFFFAFAAVVDQPSPPFLLSWLHLILCVFLFCIRKKFWFYWCDHQIFALVTFSSQALLCLLKLICIRGMGNLLCVVSCWFTHGDNIALVEALLEIIAWQHTHIWTIGERQIVVVVAVQSQFFNHWQLE